MKSWWIAAPAASAGAAASNIAEAKEKMTDRAMPPLLEPIEQSYLRCARIIVYVAVHRAVFLRASAVGEQDAGARRFGPQASVDRAEERRADDHRAGRQGRPVALRRSTPPQTASLGRRYFRLRRDRRSGKGRKPDP